MRLRVLLEVIAMLSVSRMLLLVKHVWKECIVRILVRFKAKFALLIIIVQPELRRISRILVQRERTTPTPAFTLPLSA